MTTYPTEARLVLSSPVLAMLLRDLPEPSERIGDAAGLPAGAIDVPAANLLLAATPCDPPMFRDALVNASRRFGRDVLLVRTGLFPETLNGVTVDVALTSFSDPVRIEGMSFARHLDGGLWLAPPRPEPFLRIDRGGVVLTTSSPFEDVYDCSDALCRAAAEIVRIAGGRC